MIIFQKFQPEPAIILQKLGPIGEIAAVRANALPAIPTIIGPVGPNGAPAIVDPDAVRAELNLIVAATPSFNPLPLIEFALNPGL